MKLSEIHIRDPFIYYEDDKYYLYGSRGNEAWGLCTGLDVYVSSDLEEWSLPKEVFHRPGGFWADRHFWAPEVYKYNGSYYMFVSFKSETRCRGTQILKAASPMGPFEEYSDGPVTPAEWECLDGTLYIDRGGHPYMVFCHEWVQTDDGEICAVRLSKDLKQSEGSPVVLFKGSEPAWTLKNEKTYITDGPFLYRTRTGKLLMLWSGRGRNGYVEAVSYSDNGEITGKWLHCDRPLFEDDGGHGMLFHEKSGRLYLALHSPNSSPDERPVLLPVKEENGMIGISIPAVNR